MNDETKTTETNTDGKEANQNLEDYKKDISELDKLKAANDEFEKELIRGRELKAESQKLEAEKQLAGTSGGNVEAEVKEETSKEYADKVMKGDVKGE
jgi:hypothetical protein